MQVSFFTMEPPNQWRLVDTVSTFRTIGLSKLYYKKGHIAIGQNDTLNFEFGFASRIPEEYRGIVLNGTDTLYYLTPDFDSTMKKPTGDIPKGMLPYFISTTYSPITVNGKKALLHKPIKEGIGITGIEIDSLWSNNGIAENFVLYGINLKPSNQHELIEVVKTLKFNKPK
jgi:hypothetical protein